MSKVVTFDEGPSPKPLVLLTLLLNFMPEQLCMRLRAKLVQLDTDGNYANMEYLLSSMSGENPFTLTLTALIGSLLYLKIPPKI